MTSHERPNRARGTRTRTTIVGAGLTGRWHAHAAKRAGGRITGFTDVDSTRAARLSRDFGTPVTGRTLEETLDRAPADIVHICTPLETHEELVRTAFDRGCDVLCEKPLASDAAGTQRLYGVAREQGRLLCPVHQYPFQRAVTSALARLPHLGRMLHLDSVACSAGAAEGSPADRDRLVAEILPHPLSVIDVLLSRLPEDVAWQACVGEGGEWRIMADLEATSIGILLSTAGRPTRHSIRIICEAGSLHLDLFHDFVVEEAGAVSQSRKLVRPLVLGGKLVVGAGINLARRTLHREHAFPGLNALVSAFYDAVRGDTAVPLSERHAIAVATGRDALLDCVARGH